MTTENWLTLVGIGSTLITSLISLAGVLVINRKQKQLTISVDGRLSQLLALTAKASHAEGVVQERNHPGKETK